MQGCKTRRLSRSQTATATSEDIFERLLSEIRDMSPEKGGGEALRLSSLLLEYAAFELAPRLGSDQAGALIETAAGVSFQAECYLTEAEIDEKADAPLLH